MARHVEGTDNRDQDVLARCSDTMYRSDEHRQWGTDGS